jgi:hypothetical protein
MAVAFIALLAALSGTAVALPGTSSVDSGDIKNKQVKGKDLANNAVTGKKVKNSSLTGADVRNDSLTGSDINEGTLGQVPSANTANTANSANTANTANTANSATTAGRAGDLAGRKIDFRVPPGTGATQVLNLGGLVLTASCSAAGNLSVVASTTVEDAYFISRSLDNTTVTNLFQNTDFDAGDDQDIVATVQEFILGWTNYENKNGSAVTVSWQSDEDAPAAEDNCVFAGTALQG